MCGIFGYQLKSEKTTRKQRAKLFTALSILNDGRGGDSWGMALGDNQIKRGLGNISVGADPDRFSIYESLAAHTRKATTGAVTKGNAHPFVIPAGQGGDLVGSHNGIIFNHEQLNNQYYRDCAVDSEHIFRHLAEELPMEEIRGYGAIWWFLTQHPEQVYLGAMSSAELAVATLGTKEDSRGIVWSSSEHHLELALKIAKVGKHFQYKIEDNESYRAEGGILYKHQPLPTTRSFGNYGNGHSQASWYQRYDSDHTSDYDPWDTKDWKSEEKDRELDASEAKQGPTTWDARDVYKQAQQARESVTVHSSLIRYADHYEQSVMYYYEDIVYQFPELERYAAHHYQCECQGCKEIAWIDYEEETSNSTDMELYV